MSPYLSDLSQTTHAIGIAIIGVPIALYVLRKLLLPRPIPGIPYSKEGASSILGDLPAILRESPKNPHGWIIDQIRRHNNPIAQVFLLPFGKPSIIISDFREAQDIMVRRKEFDRSSLIIDTIGGEAPLFHANMRTNTTWKAHRKLLQDLMSPEFLHNVAAPNIYKSVTRLMELWHMKSDIVGTVPFEPKVDLFHTSLDAIFDFGYGDAAVERVLIPQLEVMSQLTEEQRTAIADRARRGHTFEFPTAPVPAPMHAILKTANHILPPMAYGFPTVGWWIIGLFPSVRKMRVVRDAFIKGQVLKSAEKLEKTSEKDRNSSVQSAMDHIVGRERAMAESAGRKPVYWSQAIQDEVFGFNSAGHETTSTALLWAVKYLADCADVQNHLRETLHAAFADAFAEDRPPTESELASARIPYLDAVVEEVARLAHVVPVHERECTEDTVVLGHLIPKGTFLFLANKGPGYTEPPLSVDESIRSESCQAALKEKRTVVLAESEQVRMNDFRPERWLVTNAEGQETVDTTAWPASPFGMGRRGCFGQKLARLEIKIVVALMIWNFELLPCPGEMSSYEETQPKMREPLHCFVSLGPTLHA
ncbi:hypothetical protein PWT90_08380 [Aphanocladium album]|nr:hypothetical protein PWT90_08380 [Aphanocladium album]